MGRSELEAWRRAVAGDRDALVALLDAHGPAVGRNLASSIPVQWRSVLAIDDIMQQTYIDAVLTISQCVPQGDGAFDAWLGALARCNLRDAVRMLEADKRGGGWRRVPLPSPEDSWLGLLETLSESGTTPSSRAEREEAVAALKQAIEELPPDYRRVVRAYDLEGQSIDAVAEQLQRSPGAVFMMRARAHRRLRERLARFVGDRDGGQE
jgi:RNA polymerase sigma factor (sigma-70 family)